eukprot:GILI01045326.1.p1 GENE.GILI01045326.1~~GILI01045326.1.p1  ORF type:complete len:387 (-),score=84.17 GILI01045326.1:40-1146(-)
MLLRAGVVRPLTANNAVFRSFSTQSSTPQKKIVLSGIQPTGTVHIGNYLGAVSNWVKMQDDPQMSRMFFSIVDLHAITATYKTGVPSGEAGNVLRQAWFSTTATLLACGLDPKKMVLFRQSEVPEHCELSWILGCITPMSWLARMTQFKEKKGKSDDAKLGLFSYPVLMAADILLYRATDVPVGDDQRQHLELAREIAVTFNRDVANGRELFPLPRANYTSFTRVMSLRDASSKMSKSDPDDKSRISLLDDADMIKKKIATAKTDSILGITWEPEQRPEVANLVRIFAAFSNLKEEEVAERYKSAQNSVFKKDLTEAICSRILPIREEVLRLSRDPAIVHAILAEGREQARATASETLKEVKKAVGFL